MELFIAGGCGEHGRNCFYVEQNSAAFLVDCGLLAGAEDDLPRLNAEQIQKLRAVFLTHSHADHTRVNFLHLASKQSKLLLRKKWNYSDQLTKPET